MRTDKHFSEAMDMTNDYQPKEQSDYTSQREERLRNEDSNLGIDNEVILKKRRRAVVKLDENLLVYNYANAAYLLTDLPIVYFLLQVYLNFAEYRKRN